MYLWKVHQNTLCKIQNTTIQSPNNVEPSLEDVDEVVVFFRCNDHLRETLYHSFKTFGDISCHKIHFLHKLIFKLPTLITR